MLARVERRIELRPEGGLFVVEVLPPLEEGASFDATYATYKAARGYARTTRLLTGWNLVDLCAESDV
jgi:hypothetical protein